MRAWTKVANWLDRRFPERTVVTVENYNSIHAELSELRSILNNVRPFADKLNERLSVVEANAVHKGAVSDLVIAVKALKEDYASFKANTLGGNKTLTEEDINALFNGGPING